MSRSLMARIERLELTARTHESDKGFIMIHEIVRPGDLFKGNLTGLRIIEGESFPRPAFEPELAFMDRMIAQLAREGRHVRIIAERDPPAPALTIAMTPEQAAHADKQLMG